MSFRRLPLGSRSIPRLQTSKRAPGSKSRRCAGRWAVVITLRRIAAVALLMASIPSLVGQSASPDDPEWHYRRAQEAMARQDYETAAKAWEAICSLMPQYPEAHSNLGLVYHLQRKYSLSIPKFKQALQQNPQLLSARVFLGIDYYLTSRPRLAITELTRATREAPENFEARKWLALSHFQAGDFGTAIRELEACQRLEGAGPELLFHLGRAYRKVATKAFFTMRESRFESAWFYLSRGDQFRRMGNHGVALEEFRHAARADPGLPGVHYRIGQLLEARGELVESALAYSSELANFPSHARSQTALWQVLKLLGMALESLEVRERAEAIHAKHPTALKLLRAAGPGSVSAGPASAEDTIRVKGALSRAIEAMDGARTDRAHSALLAQEPQRALEFARQDHGEDASYWIGRAYLNLGDLDKALTNLLTAQARQAASAEVAFYLHRCADRLSARALEAYAAQRPDSYRTHQLRAEYLNASGDHERAIAEYRKALSIEPGAALLHLEIGKIRLGQREYDEAIAAFDAELAVDAYSVEALTRAGESYYLSSKPDVAMRYLERALSVNPRTAAAHKVIGQVFFKRRDFPRTIEHLRSALDLGIRDDGTVHYQLGRALSIVGDREGAAKHLAIVKRLREARSEIVRDRFEDLKD